MPLIKREVEPVFVSQVDILGKDIKKDELECVTNYTLASIIRQLGNLGKHAEDIFGDLLHEATSLARRAGSVQDRLDKMTNTLNNLDPLTDSVSLRDINTRLAFQSSLILDAEVVSSPTMPSAMKATYTRCEQPPRLSQLNQFRQDGKDGLKFYTDPKFFFERWVNEQRKDIDNKKKKRKKKRPHSSNVSRPKQVQKRKDKFKDQALGAEFVDIEREKLQAKAKAVSGSPPPNAEGENKRQSQLSSSPSTPRKETPDSARKRGPQRPSARAPGAPGAPGAPPPPPPPISNGVVDDSALPPPPPLDDEGTYSEVGDMPPPPPAITGNIAPPPPGAPEAPPVPAPPPPVPTSAGPAPPPPPPLPGASSGGGGPPLPKQNSGSANPRPTTAVSQVTAPRDDLLSAIKQGMQLRRVDVKVKDRPNEPENNSVEAILRRRIAVELSSDEETGSEFCSDDSEWEDDD